MNRTETIPSIAASRGNGAGKQREVNSDCVPDFSIRIPTASPVLSPLLAQRSHFAKASLPEFQFLGPKRAWCDAVNWALEETK